MKKQSKTILTILGIIILVVCAIITLKHPPTEYTKGSSSTSKKPKLIMVDYKETDNYGLPEEMEKVGCEVTLVWDEKDINTTDFDGLLVPGGFDVDPSLWGDDPHPAAGNFDLEHDMLQINAIKEFAKAGKPILGICRGEQLINVAMGGAMIQNLIDESNKPTYEKGFHRVENVKGSWIYDVYGPNPNVSFYHHQAVDPNRLGKGIQITSWSTDHKEKHVEAIEHESLPIYGVQWHPDSDVAEQGTAIFEAFYKECLNDMEKREKQNDE